MKRLLEQLMKQADERKQALRDGNDLSEQERQIQQIELKLLVEQIEQMRNRFAGLDRVPAKMGPKEPRQVEREAEFGSLKRKDAELGLKTNTFERELDRQVRDGREPEARKMKSRLETPQGERAEPQKRLDDLKRAPTDDFKRRKLDEIKREEVRPGQGWRELTAEKQDREVEETRMKIDALERGPRLESKKEAGDLAPKREYRIVKEDVKIGKKAPDGPPRIVKGPAGNPRLEAEVEDLRVQMKELHEQMRQMQKLLEQSVERGRPEKMER